MDNDTRVECSFVDTTDIFQTIREEIFVVFNAEEVSVSSSEIVIDDLLFYTNQKLRKFLDGGYSEHNALTLVFPEERDVYAQEL